MKSFTQRRLETEFKAWLDEEVYISKGIEHCPRKYVILEMIYELREFLQKEGYNFRTVEKDMAQDWARFLFRSQKGLLNGHKHARNPNETPEDYDMYYHLYDDDRWKPFLAKWKDNDDFCLNREGEMALLTLPEFGWFHVNISTSEPTARVDEMMAASDSEEDGAAKKRKPRTSADPYLEDLANAVSKQNRWD